MKPLEQIEKEMLEGYGCRLMLESLINEIKCQREAQNDMLIRLEKRIQERIAAYDAVRESGNE